MTPLAIIQTAKTDGVRLTLTTTGTVKAAGERQAVNRWLPFIRSHKTGIIAVLEAANDSAICTRDLHPLDGNEAGLQRVIAYAKRTAAPSNGLCMKAVEALERSLTTGNQP